MTSTETKMDRLRQLLCETTSATCDRYTFDWQYLLAWCVHHHDSCTAVSRLGTRSSYFPLFYISQIGLVKIRISPIGKLIRTQILLLSQSVIMSRKSRPALRFRLCIYGAVSGLALLADVIWELFVVAHTPNSANVGLATPFQWLALSGQLVCGLGVVLSAITHPRRPDVHISGHVVDGQRTVSLFDRYETNPQIRVRHLLAPVASFLGRVRYSRCLIPMPQRNSQTYRNSIERHVPKFSYTSLG